MNKQIKAAAISFLLFTTGAVAQTTVTGTGTANTIPLFTGSATLGNSNITQSNGNVGIGTTTPANPLNVYVPASSSQIGAMSIDVASFGTGANAVASYFFRVRDLGSNSTHFYINGIGNVGVGTTSPGQLLQVGATYSQNPAIMIGGTDSNNSSTGNYALLFGAFRDVESIASGIVATPTWVCCGGYPAAGYAGIRQNSLGFYTIYDPAKPTAYAPNMLINTNGNVGIGTATPGSPLEVNGNLKLTAGSGASITFPDATVQSTAWNGTLPGGDYAESIDVQGDRTTYEPGDVIVIDPTAPGKFIKSEKAYSKLVAGVFSTKPGLVGRRATTARPDKEAEVPMAMMGIVPTKVSSENGAIEPGDLLVSASTPGYAMKGTDSARLTGAVIGKALAPLKSGSGVIEVLISLQ